MKRNNYYGILENEQFGLISYLRDVCELLVKSREVNREGTDRIAREILTTLSNSGYPMFKDLTPSLDMNELLMLCKRESSYESDNVSLRLNPND